MSEEKINRPLDREEENRELNENELSEVDGAGKREWKAVWICRHCRIPVKSEHPYKCPKCGLPRDHA